MDNILSLIRLHSGGFTQLDLKKLFANEENYTEILNEFLNQWRSIAPWITNERKEKILEKITKVNIENIKNILETKHIEIITIHSEKYPEKLKTIKQSPYLLYVRGDIREERKMLGIVGSRRSTSYGKKILEKIIPELVRAQCGIVSGWAHGIDTLSHSITLDTSGYTISVFGSGIDIYYPPENARLFDTIVTEWGALVSIFPIGTLPEPYNFPIRNEIVAALSDGIIIPEAGIKSGTLITAQLALDHGRDVFAIPGDVFRETSIGTNTLIARGEAKCIQNATGILEEYFPNVTSTTLSLFSEKSFDDDTQKSIYNCIMEWYNTPDSIWENSIYDIETIIMTLTLMEIEGHIKLGWGGKYEAL